MITFTLTGQMPSGKNQIQQLWRHGKLVKVPNARFENWRWDAGTQLLQQRVIPKEPIDKPVKLYCFYIPGDRITRDIPGMQDALYHLLVHCHILKDDGLIYDCDWRRGLLSNKPQIDVALYEWKEPRL